jgi:hypothetical protein
LPHSEIPGSKPARGSPRHIAACHVLHRLSTPRHPPDALLTLAPPQRQHHVQMSDDRRQRSEGQALRSAAVSLHLPWPARARQHTQSPARGNTQGSIPMPDTGPMTGKGKPHPLLDRHPPVTRPATPQGTRIPKGRPAHTHHHTISRQGAAPPCRHTGTRTGQRPDRLPNTLSTTEPGPGRRPGLGGPGPT